MHSSIRLAACDRERTDAFHRWSAYLPDVLDEKGTLRGQTGRFLLFFSLPFHDGSSLRRLTPQAPEALRLIVQTDAFPANHASVMVCKFVELPVLKISTFMADLRRDVSPPAIL
jgi:hypothetical protein